MVLLWTTGQLPDKRPEAKREEATNLQSQPDPAATMKGRFFFSVEAHIVISNTLLLIILIHWEKDGLYILLLYGLYTGPKRAEINMITAKLCVSPRVTRSQQKIYIYILYTVYTKFDPQIPINRTWSPHSLAVRSFWQQCVGLGVAGVFKSHTDTPVPGFGCFGWCSAV